MKAGWTDIQFIKNQPLPSRRSNNQRQWVAPTVYLRSKLSYEKYRENSPDTTSASSPIAPEMTSHKSLHDKLGYDAHRPQAADNLDDSGFETASPKRARTPNRRYHDHGLGASRETIIATCERLAGGRFLALGILFSVDADLLRLVSEAGEDKYSFSDTCAEHYIPNLAQALGWGNSIEFSFVRHEKPDRLRREGMHYHITTAGSTLNPETGNRRGLPYIESTDLQRSQQVADHTVEAELDLLLGREWRLQVPEYWHTYAQPEPATRAEPVVPLPEDEPRLSAPALLFPLAADSSATASSPDNAPPILWLPATATPVEYDDFGDTEQLSRLVDDLFGTALWQPVLEPSAPSEADSLLSKAAVEARPVELDEGAETDQLPTTYSSIQRTVEEGQQASDVTVQAENAEGLDVQQLPPSTPPGDSPAVPIAVQDRPQESPEATLYGSDVSTVYQTSTLQSEADLDREMMELFGELAPDEPWFASLFKAAPIPETLVIEEDDLDEGVVYLAWYMSTSGEPFAVALEPVWDDKIGLGTIVAHVEWLEANAAEGSTATYAIYQTSVMDYVVEVPDFEGAMLTTQARLEAQFVRLNDMLRSDFDQGLVALYQAWFQTMALDEEAVQQGFFPELPASLLDLDEYAACQGFDLLPGVQWFHDKETDCDYGLTVDVAGSGAEIGCFWQSLQRWTDADGVQKIDIIAIAQEAGSVETSFHTFWEMNCALAYGVALDADAAWQKWDSYFAENEEDLENEEMEITLDEDGDIPDFDED